MTLNGYTGLSRADDMRVDRDRTIRLHWEYQRVFPKCERFCH